MPTPKYSEDDMDTEVQPESPDESAPEQPAQNEHTLFISPEHLGGLDPDSINPGDILEFKVVGRDSEGDIEVEYNTGDKGSAMDRMNKDFADHMNSPEEQPAAPAAGGGGY